uniref:Uncharacterized protein n=1 Tax=Eptatretus burgeri TaxID=7764 RepID=A0A8C4QU95_EPTBU
MLIQEQDRLRESLERQRTPEGAVSVTPSFCSNCRETQEVLKLSMKFGEELHHNLNRVELILHQEQTLREEALAEKMKLMRRNLELEFQLESRPVKKDIPRQQKQLENRILELEAELEEERNNVQTLTANAERRKEQVRNFSLIIKYFFILHSDSPEGAGDRMLAQRGHGDRSDRVHGDRSERVHGDRSKRVHGDRSDRVHGDQSDWVHGDRSDRGHGNRSDWVHGDRSDRIHGDQS